jgi:hypothetical protein
LGERRHHTYKKEGHKNVDLTEVGPRFELKLYQIKLGTVGTLCFPHLPSPPWHAARESFVDVPSGGHPSLCVRTTDLAEADNEWVLKPFMSNAKRKQNLSSV